MALVCDFKSESPTEKPQEEVDLEDGEITDDDEEESVETAQPIISEPVPIIPNAASIPSVSAIKKSPPREVKEVALNERERFSDERFSDERERKDRRVKERPPRDEKGHRHMTEAEKSILHLRKREKMMREREKWEKQQRKDLDVADNDDDFAKNIEKTLATILNKKEKEAAALSAGEEGKEEEKRVKKRKKHDKDKERVKRSKRSQESPRSEIDENDIMNVRGGSPSDELRSNPFMAPHCLQQPKSEESISEYSSDEREERLRRRANKSRRKKEARDRNRREREQRRQQEQSKIPLQDSRGVCVFYMQGKCQKNDCPYSHEVTPPMKLELCKFYLMDCCAKGDKCSYMHSEFPCKFYHTGLQCNQGDNCKFAHGPALSEGLKQILFKHIETAPREILGGYPRLSREEALGLINQTQQKLLDEYGEQGVMPSNYNSSMKEYASQNASGPMMYGSRYPNFEDRDISDREKEPSKGGMPSLFDISVPVPPELAFGLDFDIKNPKRVKQSRWQKDSDDKPVTNFYSKSFSYGADQDMRINSNGDIDMRTLPAISSLPVSSSMKSQDGLDQYQRDVALPTSDIDIRSSTLDFTRDIDIRPTVTRYTSPMDVDIRHIPKSYDDKHQTDTEDELHIDTGEDKKDTSRHNKVELPQTTRELYARIFANQKDNTIQSPSQNQPSSNTGNFNIEDQNINWYSDDDDDDDNRLTIKVEEEESSRRERNDSVGSTSGFDKVAFSDSQKSDNSPSLLSANIVEKLGDLSKIDISAEVTKLLTSMSQTRNQSLSQDSTLTVSSSNSQAETAFSTNSIQDPRTAARQDQGGTSSSAKESTAPRKDPRLANLDPRQRPRQSSTDSQGKDKKSEKISIYEQGGLDMKRAALEIDGDEVKASRPDIDLRNLSLPFKGMQNYTPATEIDASINSHPPLVWKVYIVEIPRPDYTGLKLSINEAEKTGDPRLRKIFRLSVDEKDSPMSPKASPKQSTGTRADPRLRKMEEKSQELLHNPQMSYSQQLNMLQSSQFYQSLTSNQKVMLNQELASRYDQSGGAGLHDPVLNTLLSNLNILPQAVAASQQPALATNPNLGAALSILANVTKVNPIIQNQTLIGQQGLLGAAPGIPNISSMSQDFSMNFGPRNGGLLGNGPPRGYGQFDSSPFGFNDEFGSYDDMDHPVGNMGPQGGGNFRHGRGYNNNNRDGRRRGNRNNYGGRGNRNFKRGGGRGDRDGRGDRERGRPSLHHMREHTPP